MYYLVTKSSIVANLSSGQSYLITRPMDGMKWNHFRVTGHLRVKLLVTGRLPSQNTCNSDFWCFLWCLTYINIWTNSRVADD